MSAGRLTPPMGLPASRGGQWNDNFPVRLLDRLAGKLYRKSQGIPALMSSELSEIDMSTVKGVVFDLDDTLILSTVDYARFKRLIIDRIAATTGDDPCHYSPSEGIISLIDRFRSRMAERGEDAERVAAELAEFDNIMDGVELERIQETREIPGARELLILLRAHSIKVGVLTRGCGSYAAAALELTGMAGLVDAVECRNSRVPPKPNPESYWRLVDRLGLRPEETIFVGDHTIDLVCAQRAGVRFIGVMTGDLSEQELMDAGSAAVFESVAEMLLWATAALGEGVD